MQNWALEANLGGWICGIDEVGRGPWAGPVVTAACVLHPAHVPLDLRDSKQLSALQRERIAAELRSLAAEGRCWYALAEASVEEIDALNILRATMLAMQRAFEALQHQCPHAVTHVLVDGNRCPVLPVPATAVVKGDCLSASISAASILAKVTRDARMAMLAREYPHYGWETNAGYGTVRHQAGLASHGVTPHHRRSFKPVAALLTVAEAVEA